MYNAEQIEAHQEELNRKRADLFSKFDEKQKAKHVAVDRAIDILTKAGVTSLLFADIKYDENLSENFVQFNNFNDVINPEKILDITKDEEKCKKIHRANILSYNAVISYLIRSLLFNSIIEHLTKETENVGFIDVMHTFIGIIKKETIALCQPNKSENQS